MPALFILDRYSKNYFPALHNEDLTEGDRVAYFLSERQLLHERIEIVSSFKRERAWELHYEGLDIRDPWG
jgi:hypothetical protein